MAELSGTTKTAKDEGGRRPANIAAVFYAAEAFCRLSRLVPLDTVNHPEESADDADVRRLRSINRFTAIPVRVGGGQWF